MKYFVLVISFLLLASCANTADTLSNEPLEGEYQVTRINDNRIMSDEIIFNFDPLSSRVSGITGCNNFSANYTQNGQKLDFSTPMNTRKYCEGKMETEREILIAVERASRVEFIGNEVLIYANEANPLITLIKMK